MLNKIAKFSAATIMFGVLLSACAPSSQLPKQEAAMPSQDTPQLYISHTRNGLLTQKSQHSVAETIDRLEAAVKAKGLNVFARIDHYENAKALDIAMRPNTLLIFGSPKIGAPLMRENSAIGLDLPVKVLAYEDKDGAVFLSYNDPTYLKQRHNIHASTQPLDNMSKALAGLTAKAAGE